MRKGIVVAIDGPAASGKSYTASAVAAELGFRHVDSGAFYRAAAAAALRAASQEANAEGREPEWSEQFVMRAARRVSVVEGSGTLLLDGADASQEIRLPTVTARVSQVAAMAAVRAWVNEHVRRMAGAGGAVVDGRDIGTNVFPAAELKIYLVADPWERARRRLVQRGITNPTDDEIAEETDRLVQRDSRDASQSVPARESVLIDTTHLRPAEQVERIVALARAVSHRPD